MEKKSSLDIRKFLKRRKPKFLRQDGHKKIRLENKWKKPKGLQNKMRLKIRGYRRSVSKGYKSPKDAKGLHPSGLKINLIYTKAEMTGLNPETDGMIIGAKVSKKKKLDIAKECITKKIKILNIKDVAQFVKDFEEELRIKKETKQKKKTEKEKKKKEHKEKALKKEEKKEEKTIEDKLDDAKKKEKMEKDKVLTKKK